MPPLRNPRLDHLPDYPFPRLRTLIGGVAPGAEAIDLSIGEPRHGVPRFVTDILARDPELYGKYPPIGGTPEWQAAVAGWLTRRFNLPEDWVRPDAHVLPMNGTREGLFMLGAVAVPQEKAGGQPVVLMPNPCYQVYCAAALSAGAVPEYVPALKDRNFMPAFADLPEETLARTALAFVCSPANPQGTVAGLDYLKELIKLARAHDFVLAVDECYSEIYGDTPPPGALEACRALVEEGAGDVANPFDHVLVFHSLSKRSNLPGLRSGFVAGDPTLISEFNRLRSYGGPASPLPVYAAAAAAWNDEAHVEESRVLYRQKFDLAEEIIGDRFGFYRPEGGFFLWLDVGDSEAAALKLWQDAGVRTLPGFYLASTDAAGFNPGAGYLRLALVEGLEKTAEAFRRIVATLDA
jgi:succinyldiaminopimelate transaminase